MFGIMFWRKFMDRLMEMFSIQKHQNKVVGRTYRTPEEATKEFCLHLIGEVTELLRETNYKSHRSDKVVIESNLKEEWIDIFKYWMSIGIANGWDDITLVEEFNRKTEVVKHRYEVEKEMNLKTKKDLVALDIDGVLADYPLSFQNFIKEKTGVWVDIKGYDIYDEYSEVLGRDKLLELKHEYRESGQKRFIPVCEGAKDLCDRIHERGFGIIFLTSRPYKQYNRIFADTMEWLDKNGLKKSGDAIIFDEDKNYKAVREFPNIEFMVEDNGKFALNIAKLGYKVFLVDKLYNKDVSHKKITRLKTLGELW